MISVTQPFPINFMNISFNLKKKTRHGISTKDSEIQEKQCKQEIQLANIWGHNWKTNINVLLKKRIKGEIERNQQKIPFVYLRKVYGIIVCNAITRITRHPKTHITIYYTIFRNSTMTYHIVH